MQIEKIEVDQLDFPGWEIHRCSSGYDVSHARINETGGQDRAIFHIPFQFGGPDINGLLGELVLMTVADRLQQFQKGEFPSKWNQKAIDAIELAIGYLAARDLERKAAKCDTSVSSPE